MAFHRSLPICLIICIVLFSSCGPEIIYEKTHSFGEEGWTYKDTLDFPFEVEDTSRIYELYLNVKHDPNFSNQNLYSRIYTSFPNNPTIIDTISLELTDNTGAWLASCSARSCDLDIMLKSNTRFKDPGNYKIRLEQYNRIDSLQGIQSIAFRLQLRE